MKHAIIAQPDGSYLFQSNEPFTFENGGTIESLELVYETYGELSKKKDNVVLVHHALSTSAHLCSHPKNMSKGWWEPMVGSGGAIDTNRFFVICINNLGSCFGSSGPASMNPKKNKPYCLDFPKLTIVDMVRSQQLLLTALNIEKLYAVIGNSMGAMLSLTYTLLFPERCARLISVSSGYRTYPITMAYHAIQKAIVKLDPNWKDGYYEKSPIVGLKLARTLGLLSYRDPNDLNKRFANTQDIISYLDYNADKLVQDFDANSYLYLVEAMDEFDVTKGCKHKVDAFKNMEAETLIIAVDSDILYPPMQQQALYQYLKDTGVKTSFVQINSRYGHDAFYVDENIAKEINRFLCK